SKVQSLIKENKKVRTDIYSDDYNTDYSYKEKYIFENDNQNCKYLDLGYIKQFLLIILIIN
ncbi:hypothetical protein R4K96_07610, partial [Brachyspira intermedia]